MGSELPANGINKAVASVEAQVLLTTGMREIFLQSEQGE